jgi:uncharacterized SAM-binding protein YcdF (DUF218 family)
MIDPLWLKALLKALLLPPTSLLLLSALGLGLFGRLPRFGRALAASGILLLLVISVPVVADSLAEFVDTSSPLELTQAREAKAIVVLGGGIRRDAPEYNGDTLGSLTLERVRYGARVARLTGLPVLVSGGSVLGGAPEATLMRAALEGEFNVPVRWSEARSRTTHENAVNSAEMLREAGIHRVLLVAHGFDMRRATAEFAAQGIETIPAPTGKRGGTQDTALDFVPSMSGLLGSYFAIYEIVANLVLAASRGH